MILTIQLICPITYPNKIEVIKAIRILAGLGLKEAKDASETTTLQTFQCILEDGDKNPLFRQQCDILKKNGVVVKSNGRYHILESLRGFSIEALEVGEDELANEIMQLLLAYKLKDSA